ncbi:hypothetical protein ACTQ33_16550 [Candidatus Avoscillospira sp. LCP25S3_F1]|uniref:hypothetical protein n=1 Tax=Candidatus Avoscillospira sp. LCP25S3_F1 TaxID=3438825 RepID=UPI003F9040D9
MTEYDPEEIIIDRDSFNYETAMASAYYILRGHGTELKVGERFMEHVVTISTIVILGLIVLALSIYYMLMQRQRKIIVAENFGNCSPIIVSRYLIWYSSFSLWTIIQYFLLLVPLYTSVATIYFSADVIINNAPNSSTILLTVYAVISALFPAINSKIKSKVRADGFYMGATQLEQGLVKFSRGFIREEELIEIYVEAEKYTNPLVGKGSGADSD